LEEDGIAGEDLHAVDGPPHPHRNPDLPSPRADDDLGVPGRAALHPPSRIHAGDLGFEGLVAELRVADLTPPRVQRPRLELDERVHDRREGLGLDANLPHLGLALLWGGAAGEGEGQGQGRDGARSLHRNSLPPRKTRCFPASDAITGYSTAMTEGHEIEGGFRGRKIAWGFSGGIAAFKACQALRLFVHEGAEVRAAMTEAATRFVGPLTVGALTGAPVLTDVLEPSQDMLYGHLDLARRSDLVVVAPATADLLARLAHGMGDCAVTTTVLAARCPILLAPAMNVAMWENPAVQRNVEILRSYGHYHFVGPASGLLADGD